jgi:hypothetical protein
LARVELVHARLVDVGPIASRMRNPDRLECAALGRTPKEGLRIGLRMSLKPITVMIEGRPEGMLGAVPVSMIGGRAIVWMLGTSELYRYPRAWALLGPRVIADMLETFRSLENIVSADNVKAIRFLAHMGFHVGGTSKLHRGVPFVPFRIARAIQEVAVAA